MIRINRGHPLAIGLRNWWLMSPSDLGPGGSVLDIARKVRHVTAGNVAQAGPMFGRSSLVFPTDFSLPAVPAFPAPLTVSCWASPGVLTRGDMVTRWNTGGEVGDQFNLLYGLTSGKPQFFFANGGPGTTNGTATGSGTMAVGGWYHIVGTHDGTTGSCYLDGVLQGTSVNPINSSPSTTIQFGDNSAIPAFRAPFSGSMSDVAIWARCLSAAEVAQLYAISRVGYPGMLIGDRTPSLRLGTGQAFHPWYSPAYAGFLGTGAA